MLRARELMRKGAEVRLLTLEALADNAWVAECGGMGALVVGVERIEGYPLVFFDALRVKIRDEGHVRNKAVHIALGVRGDGTKE
ncbi:mutator family transposase, partial [Rhizobium sp. PP-F2F-G20b]